MQTRLSAIALGLALIGLGPVFAEDIPSDVVPPKPSGRPHVCFGKHYIMTKTMAPANGIDVSFTITAEGRVENPKVITPTSYELERETVLCVSVWTYHPAMRGGQPINLPWTARVMWR